MQLIAGLLVIVIIVLLWIAYLIYKIATDGSNDGPAGAESGYISEFKVYESKQLVFSIKGKFNIMALSMTDTQKASGTLAFVDTHGHATDVPDGNVEVTSSDEAIATVSYDDPSNTITVLAVAPGVATITIAARNKANVVLPFDDVAVEITTGDATS